LKFQNLFSGGRDAADPGLEHITGFLPKCHFAGKYAPYIELLFTSYFLLTLRTFTINTERAFFLSSSSSWELYAILSVMQIIVSQENA